MSKLEELELKYRNLLKERDQSTGAARYLAEKELTATRKMILKLEGQSIAEEVKGQIPALVQAAVADVVEQIAGIQKQIKANADGNHSEEGTTAEKPRDERIADALRVVLANLMNMSDEDLQHLQEEVVKARQKRQQAADQNKHAESGLNTNAANIPDPSSYFSSDIDQRIKDYFEPELPQHIKDVIEPPLPENIAAYFDQPKEVGGINVDDYFAPSDRYQVSKD
ncbi:hypothetical protein JTF93_RS06730 [Escherichia coli]|nr:hypothetical protein [Escherichia coli]